MGRIRSAALTWAPRWWRGEAGAAGAALGLLTVPAEAAFRAGVHVRNQLYSRGYRAIHKADVPVISVGNLTVGGTGKTPITAWIVGRLFEMARSPAVVLRGYGGDEIAVHRELNPGVRVFASVRRIEAVRAASAAGADCVVLDDGFQHRRLARNLDILLIAADAWQRQRRLLPRGAWREPVRSAGRADFLLVTRKAVGKETALRVLAELRVQGIEVPAAVVHLRSVAAKDFWERSPPVALEALRGRRVVAITTLADPRPLLATLAAAGANVNSLGFPDHHEFSGSDIRIIHEEMRKGVLVMTLKEAVKLRGRLEARGDAWVVEQDVVFDLGQGELETSLIKAIGEGR